jgi:hypothetical protein
VTGETGRDDWTSERFDFGMSVVGREELLTRLRKPSIEHTTNQARRRLRSSPQIQRRSCGAVKGSALATDSASCGL